MPDDSCGYDEDELDYDDAAITDHGYDSRFTPVDTLMAGPVSMHLQYADDMENGPCRDWSREYANV